MSDLFLRVLLNPRTRPIITPDTTRTDVAAIIKITVVRLNEIRKINSNNQVIQKQKNNLIHLRLRKMVDFR
jgi:hypothetical protein